MKYISNTIAIAKMSEPFDEACADTPAVNSDENNDDYTNPSNLARSANNDIDNSRNVMPLVTMPSEEDQMEGRASDFYATTATLTTTGENAECERNTIDQSHDTTEIDNESNDKKRKRINDNDNYNANGIISNLLRDLSSSSTNESMEEVSRILQELTNYCIPNLNNRHSQECQEAMKTYNGHQTIVTIMNQFIKTSSVIQQHGCCALTASISGFSKQVKERIVTTNKFAVITTVMASLLEYPDDILVQMSGCQFLANSIITLMDIPSMEHKSRLLATRTTLVLRAVHRFNTELEMQRIGCLYFLNVSRMVASFAITGTHQNDDLFIGLNETAIMQAIAKAMLRFPSCRSLQYCGCCTFLSIFQRRIDFNSYATNRSHGLSSSSIVTVTPNPKDEGNSTNRENVLSATARQDVSERGFPITSDGGNDHDNEDTLVMIRRAVQLAMAEFRTDGRISQVSNQVLRSMTGSTESAALVKETP